jgi:DNA primase
MLSIRLRFANLKKTVSIVSVLADKGLIPYFKKRGDHLFGPCPVHGGDNPGAFVVSLSKNLWHCFTGCHTGGDVVRLAQLLDRSSYAQTARYLASLADRPPVSWDSTPGSIDHTFQPFTRRLNLNPSVPWFQQKGIHPQTARAFESGAYHGSGFLADCIAVRLHDPQGNPIGYAGRRMNTDGVREHGKWKFPRSLPKKGILYNIHRINSNTPCLIVVECPWGVMRLAQLGIPAVALLGVQISPIQRDILIRFPRLILMLDGDYAGRTASAQIQRSLADSTDVHQAFLPHGKDPDDLNDDQLIALSGYFSL